MRQNLLLWIIGITSMFLLAFDTAYLMRHTSSEPALIQTNHNPSSFSPKEQNPKKKEIREDQEKEAEPLFIAHEVPFTPQAPFGGWDDLRQQSGCEEASALMAISWARGETFTPQEALDKILAAANYQQETYGSYYDTGAADTVERIFRGYFGFENARTVYDISTEDIIETLKDGFLAIVPVHGQKLNNPHFVQPGPEVHMLVVIGYDEATEEFITNDPGTRQGKNFRYSRKTLEAALRDYATGNHEPIAEERTTMIVVES